MDPWLDALADLLDVARLDATEVDELLAIARDVAHGTERRFAPLSTFLAGVAVAGAADRPVDVARVGRHIRAFVDRHEDRQPDDPAAI